MPQLPFNRLNQIRSGQEFKHYRLLEQIGEGGQGCVWSALDNKHNQIVAIKFSETPEAAEKKSTEDSLRERQIEKLMQLRHPYILPMIDYGATNVLRYSVSPYIPGGSLEDLVDAGPIPIQKALAYAAKIAAALDYLHEQGVIHRDLKPSNVLLDMRQNTYLSDFGLARIISDSTQAMHTGRGTPYYAPPEQHTMSEVSAQSDVYSFGILIYEMLTGELPWQGEKVLGIQQLQIREELPDPRELVSDLPANLAPALRKTTSALPEARPATASQVMQTLCEVFQHPAIEVASGKDWHEDAIKNLNAFEIYQKNIQNWESQGNTIPMTLTSFALIDASQKTGQKLIGEPQFLLRIAISYSYKYEEWWQATSSLQDRLAIAANLLDSDNEAIRARVTNLLCRDKMLLEKNLSKQDPLIEAVLKAIGLTQNAQTRQALLLLIKTILPTSKKWQAVSFSEQEDALIAYQALEDSPSGDQAAQLIGHLQSEKALQTLFKAAPPKRRMTALLAALQSAGSLPASIPIYPRLEVYAEWILGQAFANSGRLLLLALSSFLGAGLGFGVYTYAVYRLNVFLDTARFLTAVQHGLFIGAGFALMVPLIRIIIERFSKTPVWKRCLAATLLGGLPITSVILLYHTLLLERYEILQPANLGKSAFLLAGCLIITLGFSLASLTHARLLKTIFYAASLALTLFGTWWAHINLSLRPFPVLYYEYTWPLSQVLALIIFIAISTAVGAGLLDLNPQAGRPTGPPNPPSASSQ